MISIGTFNKEYEQIIFYGCITIEIDKFLKCCDYKKCVIVDSNYKLWNTEYKNIPIVSIEKAVEFVCINSGLVILPTQDEQDIYSLLRRKGYKGDIYYKDMIIASDTQDSVGVNGYTVERHTQLLIAALKEYGIHNVVVSPGTCNMNLVYSLQNDNFFNLYSCIDERSAAYMACGMSQATGEPVVLSCTGATASRNYMSALTEAYYSKIPLLVITSSRDSFMINNGIDQITDRMHLPTDIVGYNTEITFISTRNEYEYCKLNLKKAFSHLYLQGGRPVHINLITRFEKDFSFKTLPEFEKLHLYKVGEQLPSIPHNTALHILPGCRINNELTFLIEKFSESYGVVVIGDHLSNYYGKNFVNTSLLSDQKNYNVVEIENLITVGEITKSSHIKAKKTWRIAEDNSIYDRDLNIEAYFDMSLEYFLRWYLEQDGNIDKNSYISKELEVISNDIYENMGELPFSNAWVAKNVLMSVPEDSVLYLGIYSSLKIWNYFKVKNKIKCFSTVGGFGIDGVMSAMIGSSIINKEKMHIAVVGDLSFFYDINSLGNNNIKSNVKIIVLNNNGGHSLKHMNGLPNTEQMPIYVSAPGHFIGDGKVIKSYVEALGFYYILAENKEEFKKGIKSFFYSNKPVVFEIKYESCNDSEAMNLLTKMK